MGAHFFLARCHTLHHIAHVMTTQTANGHGVSAVHIRTINTPQQGTQYSADGEQWFSTEREARDHRKKYLLQLAADAFVTWEQCAGREKAEACWQCYQESCREFVDLGDSWPEKSFLRLTGRFNGDGTI